MPEKEFFDKESLLVIVKEDGSPIIEKYEGPGLSCEHRFTNTEWDFKKWFDGTLEWPEEPGYYLMELVYSANYSNRTGAPPREFEINSVKWHKAVKRDHSIIVGDRVLIGNRKSSGPVA